MTSELTRSELETLGQYNAERARGLVHDKETVERMAALQERFDARQAYLTAEIERAEVELEWLERTAPPRWLVWLLFVASICGWAIALVQFLGGRR